MELPAIATNHSGPSAFVTPANGFPLPVANRLTGGFAEPSVADLQRTMRRVSEDYTLVRERGRRAREDMVQISAEAADSVMRRLRAIAGELCGEKGCERPAIRTAFRPPFGLQRCPFRGS